MKPGISHPTHIGSRRSDQQRTDFLPCLARPDVVAALQPDFTQLQ